VAYQRENGKNGARLIAGMAGYGLMTGRSFGCDRSGTTILVLRFCRSPEAFVKLGASRRDAPAADAAGSGGRKPVRQDADAARRLAANSLQPAIITCTNQHRPHQTRASVSIITSQSAQGRRGFLRAGVWFGTTVISRHREGPGRSRQGDAGRLTGPGMAN
jgi:hypothetical protein